MKHKSNENKGNPPIDNAGSSLPETAGERVLSDLVTFNDAIHRSVGRTWGLSGWFKAYIQSSDFAALDKDDKALTFETYEHLKFVLSAINEDMEALKQEYPLFG